MVTTNSASFVNVTISSTTPVPKLKVTLPNPPLKIARILGSHHLHVFVDKGAGFLQSACSKSYRYESKYVRNLFADSKVCVPCRIGWRHPEQVTFANYRWQIIRNGRLRPSGRKS